MAALGVHLGHQRAGGIEDVQAALFSVQLDLLGDAVSAEDGDTVGRNFRQVLDEPGAARLQGVDHPFIVHDLVTHIDRRPVFLERAFDDLDGAHHAGAKSARLREDDPHRAPPLAPRPIAAPAVRKSGVRPLMASKTLATMPFASRPARAYMAAGESWSMNASGKNIDRTLNPDCSSAPVPARNCSTWEP